jgi:hypothetical protein
MQGLLLVIPPQLFRARSMADERAKGDEEEAKARETIGEELPLDSETKLPHPVIVL